MNNPRPAIKATTTSSAAAPSGTSRSSPASSALAELTLGGTRGVPRAETWDVQSHTTEDLQREYDMLADLFLSEDAILNETDDLESRPGNKAGASLRQGNSGASTLNRAGVTKRTNKSPEVSSQMNTAPAVNGECRPSPAIHWDDQTDNSGEHVGPTALTNGQHRDVTHSAGMSTATPALSRAVRAITAPGVECLITGHLSPASSGLVRGYARVCAHAGNTPVALLRLNAGVLTLEVIPCEGTSTDAGDSRHPTADTRSVQEALGRARRVSPRLLVHVEETHELDILTSIAAPGPFTRVTVLCGADDGAVVATYRTIKRFLHSEQVRVHIPSRDSSGGSHSPDTDGVGLQSWLDFTPPPGTSPMMGVAVLGADAQGADQAFSRFTRAAHTFLGANIPGFAAAIPVAPSTSSQFGSTAVQSLFRGQWEHPAQKLVELITQAWECNITSGPSPSPRHIRTAIDSGLVRGLQSVLATGTPKQPSASRSLPRLNGAPTDTAVARNAGPKPSAALLEGLTPLASRSPYNPRIELAVDDAGTLHLIASSLSAGSAVSESAGELLTVSSWARDHAAILALAHPGISQRTLDAHGPDLHVITDDARDLRGVISTGVRLHLATPILVAGRTQWVCREIS